MRNSIRTNLWARALGSAGVLFFGLICFWTGRHSVPARASLPSQTARQASNVTAGFAVGSGPGAPETTAASQPVPTSNPQAPWDKKRWDLLLSQPGTQARNEALASMVEALAALDPEQAMALVQGQANLKLQDSLLQAALHGWARVSPTNAANWALGLSDPSRREAALTSVFAGALDTNPDAVVRVCGLVCLRDPGGATGYGSHLIDSLCDAGNFDAAAGLAADGAGTVQRAIWMAEAYSKWAEQQPEQAAAAALAISDPEVRNEALHGVVGGWAVVDPGGLAQFLSQQPSDGDRSLMLGQALQRWVEQDPEAAANWINENTAQLGADLDRGVESVAALNTIKPDLAVNWAESIDDPKLRSTALTGILRNWMLTDLPAARLFFENTRDLQAADRQQLAEILAGFSGQTAAQ